MQYNNSKKNIVLPLVIAVSLIIGLVLGFMLHRSDRQIGSSPTITLSGSPGDKISAMLSLIKTQYVDNVPLDSLADDVIPVLLENLDPHSVYIPASELSELNEPLEGQFDGIGVTFNMMTDTVLVLNVISGGPSDKAGVQNGDRIITINDSIVAGRNIPQNDVVKQLRGQRGTDVRLGLKRSGIEGLVYVTVTRGVIPVKSVDAGYLIRDSIGYIKLTRFSRNTHNEVAELAGQMKKAGMKELILDLRDNTGGFLDQAIQVAQEFLPEGSLIVYTEGKSRKKSEWFSNGRGSLKDIGVVILINESSASASEIVAGAIQDNDRGTIIGRRSFGKGLVQEQIPFKDGSAVRLTVARYYTPVGRSIQKPYDDGVESYHKDLYNRFEHSEFFTADSIQFPDSLKFTTPKGKTVYGGGGIMPDVFVPIDTNLVNDYSEQVFGKNLHVRYSFEYADRHRKELNRILTLRQMDDYFQANKEILNEFLRYVSSTGVTPKQNELAESRDLIEAYLKAYIARNTPLEDNGFYYYANKADNVMNKTLDFLSKSDAE